MTTTNPKVLNVSDLPKKPNAPPPKEKRTWLWIGLTLGAVLIAGAVIWFLLKPQPTNTIAFSGRIEGYETDISTKSPGRVESVSVREGDTVKQGQMLVHLEDAEIQAEYQVASSQVVAAQKRAMDARLQISVAENQIADAKLSYQQTVGDSQGKVAEAEGLVTTAQAFSEQEKARVEEARALLEQARVDQQRYATLAQEGADTAQRYDLAKTAYNTALAALHSREKAAEAAHQAIEVAQGKWQQAQTTTVNPDRQETQIARLQTQLAQSRSRWAATQADTKTAQANRQLIQTRLNNLTVNSPIDGVITVRSIEPGTVVLPTRPLLRIVNLNKVYMRGFIPEAEIGKIKVGQTAFVFLDTDLDHKTPLKATVAAIDAKASFTPENIYFKRDRVQQVFGVKLSINKPGGFAKPGMPVDAEIKPE
jgi:HlyD family secretion protein